MKLPTIGELRHRLSLEAVSIAPDGGGGGEATWSLVTEVWAAIRALGGGETVRAEALEGRVTCEVWVRWRPQIAPKARFTTGSRHFDIRAVLDPDGRRRWLRCLCEERVG